MGESGNSSERREGRRVGIYEPMRLRPNEWSSLEIRVLDISAEGFRASCEATLKKLAWIFVDLPGIGPIHAQVRWQRGDEIGAEFVRPIDLARCAWQPASGEKLLARLLDQRAKARREGKQEEERLLRRKIASSLPMVKLDPPK